MANNNEHCSGLIRFLLIITNICFLVLGIVVLITGGMLKYNTGSVESFSNLDGVNLLSVILICIGTFAILVSIFGIMGARYLNRFFLIIYLAIVLAMFLLHGFSLSYLMAKTNEIETEYKSQLNETVYHIKTNASDFTEQCKVMKGLSTLCDCCGYNGANDFSGPIIAQCCAPLTNHTTGCSQTSFDLLKRLAHNLFVIPSLVILVIELCSIIFVPFLIGKRRSEYDSI